MSDLDNILRICYNYGGMDMSKKQNKRAASNKPKTNYEICYDFLNSLEDDMNPSFTREIENFINTCKIDNESLEKELCDILERDDDNQIKFNAFYSLSVLYRKQKSFSKLSKIVNDFQALFYEKPLFLYLKSSIYKKKLTKRDAMLGIEYALQAINIIEKKRIRYPGFYQNYADAVATAFENQLIKDVKLINEGIIKINKAISIDPNYAKYYYTLGRLQILCGEFNEAKQNFFLAMDIEDPSRKDFAIRISEYQDAMMKCSVIQTLKEYEKSKKNLQEEINDTRNSIIQFIGFFAAILALVLTAVQVSVELPINDAIRVIGFMIGGIMVALGCLRLILSFNLKSFLQAILMGVIGIAFIMFAILVIPNFL